MRHTHTLSEELRRLAADTPADRTDHIGPARIPHRRSERPHDLAPRSLVTDNRARTYLANERTFLAWLRTGITMIALGLAVLEFLARRSAAGIGSEVLAFVLIAGGTTLVVVEWFRYRRRDRQIEHGDLHGSRGAISLAAGIIAAIGVLAAWFVGSIG